MKKKIVIITATLAVALLIVVVSQSKEKQTTQSVIECQKVAIKEPTPIMMNQPFEQNKAPEGREFYMLSNQSSPWSSESFDVDGDGKPEDIMTANLAMNHTPHLLKIVKEGQVIFEAEGANIYAEAVEDGNGFVLGITTDWNTNQTKRTRYEYKNGEFIPVWYQENCR
ncbi:hypothetical protein A3D84_03345 [Candidatus Woesebacteria bacterium RIFCSPHIGHO2_02_FULL_42_20]|uniref:Uncharacterized protein n=1 Tax=Candidatus Woesebacteria bacterium RIFCSPHIGHO2_12_FULL_41_24 TaxID=1802510 RepID=A0A1F8ARW0_9BACT|nr:MAG: hypothetical protein A2W15_03535 [Candidatus Woesebacteria bacterium RBG_16_41_13]OGM29916.1 MAG: hypothetical protein A2873_03355 [Candidatus Woesebacteria bacterium RIFCSPHIGHO2_01_FULL_42_80]OGM34875.1 MAG: hypothetical protein A3D84_03345 [Candidatus Woesebacteria bacterium RIFCSPHIGHO2_02_FULL_42_20]OGM54504.1 MAG: hypothetical protein A3E44_00380 [Candidatus Woesebacteria bacterium RIFCSPHIGHO2_12_FULL_41_24]OGM65748.1 MAG: hypothetical protein A2969_00780 [Candidatus Woesebacteri